MKNPTLSFQFEACWAKEDEAKDLIKRVWDQCNGDVLTGSDHIRLHLGKWRNKRNIIEGLHDTEGNWVSNTRRVCQVAWDYFHYLFKIEAHRNLERALGLIPNCITSDMNSVLDCSLTDKELVEAFNQMDPCKALGIDGLSGSLL
ncbi:hypothetical protein PVK06_035596 [Gossypium arboreum]|uniref:Uncharacterized protein n=1 Tax=Gossypium arboreum TaxID=29729 RepID=A0ABR0NKA1_GOSAR|nr:hypothetical protein PVK06_035596 [Gossypium arboreum]